MVYSYQRIGISDHLTIEHRYGQRREFQYLFTDLLSGAIIAELPMTDVQLSWQVRKPGQLSGTIPVPLPQRGRDFFASTQPGKVGIYVIREGVPIWGGIIWKRSFGSDSRQIKIEADTWDSLMYHRILDQEWLFIRDIANPDVSKRTEGVEQIEIFRQMWKYMAGERNSNLRVALGQQTSPVRRGALFKKWDFKTYGEHLEAFASLSNGFEWVSSVGVDPYGALERRIDFAHPRFGRPWLDSRLVWEYPGPLVSYDISTDSDKAATVAFILGKGDGDLRTFVRKENTAPLNQGYIRMDEQYQHNTVYDSDILSSHANKYLRAYRPPVTGMSIRTHPRLVGGGGDYFLGDIVRLVIDDDFFRLAELPDEDMFVRITGISLSPGGSDGLESIEPAIEVVARTLEIIDQEEIDGDLVPDDWQGPAIEEPDVEPEPTPPGEEEDGGRAAAVHWDRSRSWRRGVSAKAQGDPGSASYWLASEP